MDSDNPTLRWSLAAVGVVVVCFCLGYFVLSPKGSPEPVATPRPVVATPTPEPPALAITAVPSEDLKVTDITAQKDAARKRKEEEDRKRLEEAARKAEEASGMVEASPTPTPDDPAPTPDPSATPDGTSTPETTSATPTPKPEATPKVDPKEPPRNLYRVRVGGNFSSREDAEALVTELRGRSFAATIKADQRGGKTIYHVQVGAYADPKAAERTKAEMEKNGYDASIH